MTTATKPVDSYLAQTLTQVGFLTESHKTNPLPYELFKFIRTPNTGSAFKLTYPQLEAVNRIWDIQLEAQSGLNPELLEVFKSKLLEIVRAAKRVTFPPNPSYEKLIQGNTLQCLILKGRISFEDALMLSSKKADLIESLGHETLCKLLERGQTLQQAIDEYDKIIQAHSMN